MLVLRLVKIYFLGFFCLFISSAYAQSSFIKALDFSNESGLNETLRALGVFEGENDRIYFSFSSIGQIVILEFNIQGQLLNSYETGGNLQWLAQGARTAYQYHNKKHIITLAGLAPNITTGLFVLDFSTNNHWAKRLSNATYRVEKAIMTADGYILTTHDIEGGVTSPYFPKIGLSLMSATDGNEVWSYMYDLSVPNAGSIIFQTASIASAPDGKYSMINLVLGANITNFSSLLQLGNNGQIVKNVAIDDSTARWLNHITDNENNVYISGSIPTIENPDFNDGLIIKLDTNYQIIWAKRVHADEFNYFDLRVSVDEDQNVYFAYASPGDFPVIAGELNQEGTLLWHKGYAAFVPRLYITAEHEMLITSAKKYFADGTSENGLVLMKTNADGSFDNCETYSTCLSVDDVFLELDSLPWEQRVSMGPTPTDIDAVSLDVNSDNYCPEPLLPQPDFSLPALVCTSTILQADSLNNHYANQVEWQITGNTLDTVFRAENFSIQIEEPGLYTVSQTIWILGCASSMSKEIEVIEGDDLVLLANDQLVCEDDFLIKPLVSFSDTARYLWNNSFEQPSFLAQTTGVYSLRVEEAGCVFSDSISLRFLDELRPEARIDLPSDTTICTEHLPFLLKPSSFYTPTFWLEGQQMNKGDSVLLRHQGAFQIFAAIEDCLIETSFELKAAPCAAEMYLPNVFSPNMDGMNDIFEPLGNNFTGLELNIFDRWGNLVFQDDQAPFQWRGKQKNAPLAQGVYLVVFKYLNKLTSKEEIRSQDVLLLW